MISNRVKALIDKSLIFKFGKILDTFVNTHKTSTMMLMWAKSWWKLSISIRRLLFDNLIIETKNMWVSRTRVSLGVGLLKFHPHHIHPPWSTELWSIWSILLLQFWCRNYYFSWSDPKWKTIFGKSKRVFSQNKNLFGETLQTLPIFKVMKWLSHLELLLAWCEICHWRVVCDPTQTQETIRTRCLTGIYQPTKYVSSAQACLPSSSVSYDEEGSRESCDN
jgi:hypothetical protein